MHQLTTRIHQRLISELLGKPLVGNAFRDTLLEAIVAEALAPKWRWYAGGWASFDFEGPAGIGLEVKQSAARQNWHGPDAKPCPARIDIRERTGYWEDEVRCVDAPGRRAAIYLFAHHPVADGTADHRDPMQWDFYLVPTSKLPAQKSIGLAAVRALSERVSFDDLLASVSACFARLEPWSPRP